jgi:hypothetical protein
MKTADLKMKKNIFIVILTTIITTTLFSTGFADTAPMGNLATAEMQCIQKLTHTKNTRAITSSN